MVRKGDMTQHCGGLGEMIEASGDVSTGRPGGKVVHKAFGVGTVVSIDEGDDPIVTVKFPGHGLKRIKAAFLRFS